MLVRIGHLMTGPVGVYGQAGGEVLLPSDLMTGPHFSLPQTAPGALRLFVNGEVGKCLTRQRSPEAWQVPERAVWNSPPHPSSGLGLSAALGRLRHESFLETQSPRPLGALLPQVGRPCRTGSGVRGDRAIH